MVFTTSDKSLLLRSLDTERARLKRACNAASNSAIKEVLASELREVEAFAGRVHNEPVKG